MNFFHFNVLVHAKTIVCIMTIQSWIVDLTLLLRLVAIYPPRSLSRSTAFAIFAFPIVVKLGRLITIVLFIKRWVTLVNGLDNVLGAVVEIAHGPFSKAEWLLEFVDNA
jgi:hypothetical protein